MCPWTGLHCLPSSSSSCFQTDKQPVSGLTVRAPLNTNTSEWLHGSSSSSERLLLPCRPSAVGSSRQVVLCICIHLTLYRANRQPHHPPPLLMNKHTIPLFTPPSVADRASWLFCITPLLLHPCRIFITDNIHGKYRLWPRRLISLEEQTSAPVSVCLSFFLSVSPKQHFWSSWRLAPH